MCYLEAAHLYCGLNMTYNRKWFSWSCDQLDFRVHSQILHRFHLIHVNETADPESNIISTETLPTSPMIIVALLLTVATVIACGLGTTAAPYSYPLLISLWTASPSMTRLAASKASSCVSSWLLGRACILKITNFIAYKTSLYSHTT